MTGAARAQIAAMVAVGLGLAGCGSFEDPAIVKDLRTLAMVAEPPEYVIAFDPENPPAPGEIQLPPFRTCALVADPAEARTLDWRMTLCPLADDGRCAPAHPAVEIGHGTMLDPELSPGPEVPTCAWYTPDATTFQLLQDAIDADPLAGFSGVDLEVQLRVVPTGLGEDAAAYAAKRVRFAAQVPAERTPNQNPYVDRVDWDTGGDMPTSLPMPIGRCRDLVAGGLPVMDMHSDQVLYLTPQEPDGVRETYVVPTFDGGSRTFTENLSYQWLATDGSFSSPTTGGPKDPFGNSPPLHTEWTPPTADELPTDPSEYSVWVIQRDERLGAAWYQSCVRVHAPLP